MLTFLAKGMMHASFLQPDVSSKLSKPKLPQILSQKLGGVEGAFFSVTDFRSMLSESQLEVEAQLARHK